MQRSFPDHHVYTQAEIDALVKDAGESLLVTTAKDAVKLRALSFPVPCYVLEIEIAIESEEAFTRIIVDVAKR